MSRTAARALLVLAAAAGCQKPAAPEPGPQAPAAGPQPSKVVEVPYDTLWQKTAPPAPDFATQTRQLLGRQAFAKNPAPYHAAGLVGLAAAPAAPLHLAAAAGTHDGLVAAAGRQNTIVLASSTGGFRLEHLQMRGGVVSRHLLLTPPGPGDDAADRVRRFGDAVTAAVAGAGGRVTDDGPAPATPRAGRLVRYETDTRAGAVLAFVVSADDPASRTAEVVAAAGMTWPEGWTDGRTTPAVVAGQQQGPTPRLLPASSRNALAVLVEERR